MLHSLVGLYDSYLPEVTPEVLYNNLTAQNALTIVFLRDVDGMLFSSPFFTPFSWNPLLKYTFKKM